MGDRVNRLFGKSAQVIRVSAAGAIPAITRMRYLSAPPRARAAFHHDRGRSCRLSHRADTKHRIMAILATAFDTSSRETARPCRARFGCRGQEWLGFRRYTARQVMARMRSPRNTRAISWGCVLVPPTSNGSKLPYATPAEASAVSDAALISDIARCWHPGDNASIAMPGPLHM